MIVKSVAIINSEFITDKLIDVTLKYSFALTPFPSLGMDQEQFQSMYFIFFFGQDWAIKNFSLQLSIDERFNNDISSDAAFREGQSSIFCSIFHKLHSLWKYLIFFSAKTEQ